MGIIAKNMFVDRMTGATGVNLANSVYAAFGNHDIRAILQLSQFKVNRKDAESVYDLMREFIVQNGYLGGKYLRPWEIDNDLYKKLDRKEAWWGFEFETGYISQAARRTVLEQVWDTLDNTCFDSEGEGRAACEVTFAPEELSKYKNGTAQALAFMDILDRNPALIYNGRAEYVGTHINMSHPALTVNNSAWVCYCMNRTLAALPTLVNTDQGMQNTRLLMFGRRNLYGGFFRQSLDDAAWLEGKVFRTVYTKKEFDVYMKVCMALTKCMEFLATHVINQTDGPSRDSHRGRKYLYIDNLYDVAFRGAEIVVKESQFLGILDGSRAGNAINGLLGSDAPNLETTIKGLVEAHNAPNHAQFYPF